jgi:hypothetical protein
MVVVATSEAATSSRAESHSAFPHLKRMEDVMYFVAVVLALLSGLLYAAGHHEIGSYSADVCRYSGTFCENPVYVLTGAGLAAAWGAFVSVR